ncbi:hypothetical protein [Primorskyibacter marinus]|uniref:hypothetical protein n=1 Tax=Primorskyibacter marinus TaxID=1977320 RepID=UPI000E305499|nr:hypothetical protein [Primorskyibacter marinus]
MRLLLSGLALVVLGACQPGIPDSGAGAGFESYEDRARRDVALEGSSIPPVSAVSQGPITEGAPDPIDAARAALSDDAEQNSGVEPVNASPTNAAPQVVSNAAGISDENDFNAVSDERSIESDAALIARNRAQYEVVQPTALPTRSGSSGPNIVEYALRTSNPKGTPIFSRSGFNAQSKFQRNCARFASADLAQEDFLANGGPQKDRKGLDPDGDGYACAWDPAPFRTVRAVN